jgi:DDE domain
VIVRCLRWYLRYSLSYRDVEEMVTERGLSVDHSTIARWVLRYAPVLNERLRRHIRRPGRSWRVDETYVRVNGRWTYLYRALDSKGDTIDFLLSPKRDAVARPSGRHRIGYKRLRVALRSSRHASANILSGSARPSRTNLYISSKLTGGRP